MTSKFNAKSTADQVLSGVGFKAGLLWAKSEEMVGATGEYL